MSARSFPSSQHHDRAAPSPPAQRTAAAALARAFLSMTISGVAALVSISAGCGRVGFDDAVHADTSADASADGPSPGDVSVEPDLDSGESADGTHHSQHDSGNNEPDAKDDGTNTADGSHADGGCPSECDGCTEGVCHIAPDHGDVTCPPGMPCEVDCSAPGSCTDEVDCGAATYCAVDCVADGSCHEVTCSQGTCIISCSGQASCATVQCSGDAHCTIDCSGPDSCGGTPTCTGGACSVSCTGTSSCLQGVSCGLACACDVVCETASCGTVSCPGGCDVADGCTSSAAGCDTCP